MDTRLINLGWLPSAPKTEVIHIIGCLLVIVLIIQIAQIANYPVLASSTVPTNPGVFNLTGRHLSYDRETGLVKVEGNIMGQYQQYYIHADKILVYMEDGREQGLNTPAEIDISPGQFTGCDLAEPHYYFDARTVHIYPGNYLEAYRVVFRELNGKLSLFYWPYLYISLKDRPQHLIPEFGYNSRRGWFIKTTYNYPPLLGRLPGELYVDYYTISGLAAGFKQNYLYGPAQKGYIYLYGQQNRTGLTDLFNWQGAVNYQFKTGQWSGDSLLTYTDYDDSYQLGGELVITGEGGQQELNIDSDFEIRDYYLSDYRDRRNIDMGISYERLFAHNLDLDLGYDLNLDIDPEQGTSKVDQKKISLDYYPGNDWQLAVYYNQEELMEPGAEKKSRWGSRSFISKDINDDLNLKLLLERYDPRFSEEDEDKVRFYRWPELMAAYQPGDNFAYHLQAGRYYEDVSGVEGYRGEGEISYHNYWQLSARHYLRTEMTLDGRLYQPHTRINGRSTSGLTTPADQPYQVSYLNQWSLNSRLTDHLTLDNSFNYSNFLGTSPFNFDQGKRQQIFESRLRYHRQNLELNLGTGYRLIEGKYLPLNDVIKYRAGEDWSLGLGSIYDFNTRAFNSDLVLTSQYDSGRWKFNTVVKYNLNEHKLHELDNQLVLEIPGDRGWYLENNISIDNDLTQPVQEANLTLKKRFHCRELWFGYDYLNQEYTIQYRIDLLPDYGITVGHSKDQPFLFDLGIEELLTQE